MLVFVLFLISLWGHATGQRDPLGLRINEVSDRETPNLYVILKCLWFREYALIIPKKQNRGREGLTLWTAHQDRKCRGEGLSSVSLSLYHN